MTTKKTWLVILAIVLVLGMTAVGCEDNPTDDGTDPYENLSAAERWQTWSDTSSTAKISLSVDADDVAKITVSGTPEQHSNNVWNRYKVMAQYSYTASANKSYNYAFEAWTETGTRDLGVTYYYYNNDYSQDYITITEQRKTYTLTCENIPKSGAYSFQFECADQIGTFYVKIISITEVVVHKQ